MGHNEYDNHPLIGNNESQSTFWFGLFLLCKKRWKILLPVLLTLVIGTSILIGLFCFPSHIGNYCNMYVNIKAVQEKNLTNGFLCLKRGPKVYCIFYQGSSYAPKFHFETFWTPDMVNFCTGLFVNCNLLSCNAPLSYWIWKNFLIT